MDVVDLQILMNVLLVLMIVARMQCVGTPRGVLSVCAIQVILEMEKTVKVSGP